MGIILKQNNTIANQFLSELRNIDVQQDRLRFRHNLRRLSMVLGYELSKTLHYKNIKTPTPLGIDSSMLPDQNIVLATILRAGLPMHEGLLDIFDRADSAFISAYRKHHRDGSFEIEHAYITCPDINNKTVILSDPMLATGSSIDRCLKAMEEYGKPNKIHVVTAIASTDGLSYLQRQYDEIEFWVGAVDDELTAKSLIVPGLGDAGDLAYGSKLQD